MPQTTERCSIRELWSTPSVEQTQTPVSRQGSYAHLNRNGKMNAEICFKKSLIRAEYYYKRISYKYTKLFHSRAKPQTWLSRTTYLFIIYTEWWVKQTRGLPCRKWLVFQIQSRTWWTLLPRKSHKRLKRENNLLKEKTSMNKLGSH